MEERFERNTMSDNEVQKGNSKQGLIGVDPLAWLSDEEKQSVLNDSQKPETVINDDEKNQAESIYTVSLNSTLTIRDVAELMDELNQIDDTHNEIIFESELLERVDTAALQLLLGFYLFATDAGKKVIWNKPSEALCHAIEILGLKKFFNIKSIAV